MTLKDIMCDQVVTVSAIKSRWFVVCCFLLGSLHNAYGACSEPFGVANAYISSTSPYGTGDRVYYRCFDRFTMSGTPSQLCLSSGAWSGAEPTCVAHDQAVTIRQTVTSPKGTLNGKELKPSEIF